MLQMNQKPRKLFMQEVEDQPPLDMAQQLLSGILGTKVDNETISSIFNRSAQEKDAE